MGSIPTIRTNLKTDNHGELSESSLKLIQKFVDEGKKKSVSAIMSIISLKGYEDDKVGMGAKMYKIIEKELDRAKKRKFDKESAHLIKFDSKCEICRVLIKIEDYPILLRKGLLCQDCYKVIGIVHWSKDTLERSVKYIEDYEKR